MAQSSAPTKAPRRSRLGCFLVLIVLLLLIVGVAVALFWQTGKPDLSVIIVQVLTPQSGEMAEVNRPVSVSASAEHSSGITRLELYADGALVGVQQTTLPGGSNPLVLDQEWVPGSIGRHVLVARGYSRDGKFENSGVVYVDVLALTDPTLHTNVKDIAHGPTVPSLNQLSSALNVPLPQLQAANPALSGTNPDAPLPPDTPLDIPRVPAPPPAPGTVPDSGTTPPVPLPGSPAAPTGLNAVADCTSAQLSWGDSPDEEQYVIYRLGPGDPVLSRIATLPANSTSFLDTLAGPGEYRYQVAAVRGGLEGLTPMQTAATPGTCLPPAVAPGTTEVVLNFVTLETDTRYDSVYCYISIDGRSSERVPRDDFLDLVPDPTDARGLRYNLARQTVDRLPNHGQVVITGHPEGAPLTLRGECMGARGALRTSLGTFSASHPREQWDGSVREVRLDAGRSQVASLSPSVASDAPALSEIQHFHLRYVLGPNTPTFRSGILSTLLQVPIPDFRPHFNLPTVSYLLDTRDPLLPIPTNVRVVNDNSACDELRYDTTDRGAQLASVYCAVFGLPTLVWDWPGPSFTGMHDDRIAAYLVRAKVTDLLTHTESVVRSWYVAPGALKKTLIRGFTPRCNSRVSLSVEAFPRDGGYPSWDSDYVVATADTGPCTAQVDVFFDTITIGRVHWTPIICILCGAPLSHADLADPYFYAASPTKAWRLYMQPTVVTAGTFNVPNTFSLQRWESFGRDLDVMNLATSGRRYNYARINISDPSETILVWGPNFNTADWWENLFTGGSLSHFPFCGNLIIPARSLADWANINETFTGRGVRPDLLDSCTITGHVVGQRVH